MYSFNEKSISVFGDGIPYEDLKNLDRIIIDGLTYNPSLFRNIGVVDYLDYAKKISQEINDISVSFEVIADDNYNTIDQASKLSELGKNISIKVPITFTNGEITKETIIALKERNIKMNITAIFTIEQIEKILPVLKDTSTILSVFAGRLYDIGIDAKKEMKKISNFVHNNSNCKVLWASPRMSYDIISAIESEPDIITMPNSLINKLDKIGKEPSEYSLETVQMFYDDAVKSNYKI